MTENFCGIKIDTPEGDMEVRQRNIKGRNDGFFVNVKGSGWLFVAKQDFEYLVSWASALSWE